jgi:TolB protein
MSDGSGDIWVVNKDGSGLSQLTSGDTSKSHPMFSPDGSRIAFLSRPPQPSASSLISGKKNGGQYDTLWIMNFDGSGIRQLSLDRVDGEFVWSPRGDMIAFVKLSENAANLWVISADGGNEKMLSISQPFPTNPAWSPDGSRIVYSVFSPGKRNLWEALLAQ